MRPLSILFTNNTLSRRAGSELWVRDVARVLVARGHRPAAFSLVLGPIAEELRGATVPVVSDLASFTRRPDLIHAHHHIETLIAALHFPDVPIVHACHGWLPWEERPLKHPAILRYIAVDDTCADRLIDEEGIPASAVERLFNFVDLDRFLPRRLLPLTPRRALLFSNDAEHEQGFASIVREACRQANIDLEIAGRSAGRVLERPEAVLKEFDIVFAKARCALEAMAVGCSVILTDLPGAGPMVTAAEFEHLRRSNFGLRLLQRPHSVAWYREQMARYSPADAATVSARVRREADLNDAVDRLLGIYATVLMEHGRGERKADDLLASQRAAARHLASIGTELKRVHELTRQVERLASDLAVAKADAVAATVDRAALVNTYEALSVMRLRSALLRVPLVGAAAKRAARWIAARVQPVRS
jgi:hypothetical protein